MPGSRESASSEPPPVLLCGVNWIGDSVMAMPAVQAYAASRPGGRIALLVKPGVAGLWAMHPAISEILVLRPGLGGVRRAAREIRARGIRTVYVLPHSFRSALPGFLAGVPERIGLPGGLRDWMLTRVIRPRGGPGRRHQRFEYADLLLPGDDRTLPHPVLAVPAEARGTARRRLPDGDPWVGCLPGAARGPAKQWPAAHFTAVGRRVAAEDGVRIAVIGASGEAPLCEAIAEGIGPAAQSLAGRLSLAEWAAVLERCRVVVANDSGGMHLAAALGTPVVALFGHTDPERTGPLGPACILQHSAVRDREIARRSAAAQASLAAIQPDEVGAAVQAMLANPPSPGSRHA